MSPLFLPQWGNLQCQALHPTQAATGGAVRDMWFLWEFNPGFSVLSLKAKNEQKKNIYIYTSLVPPVALTVHFNHTAALLFHFYIIQCTVHHCSIFYFNVFIFPYSRSCWYFFKKYICTKPEE